MTADPQDIRLVLTDSGLGGLAVCAEIERLLRNTPHSPAVRLIYINAWPDERFGYNDLSDAAERARVFDRALAAMAGFRPDGLVIACNTLSVLYDLTDFSRTSNIPAKGIIDTGVELFL